MLTDQRTDLNGPQMMRLLLTNSRKLRADMKNHDRGHAEGKNMHKVGGGLEDDGVGQLHAPGIAVCLNACFPGDGRRWTHYRA